MLLLLVIIMLQHYYGFPIEVLGRYLFIVAMMVRLMTSKVPLVNVVIIVTLNVSLSQALSKALREDELLYLRLQFKLLEPRDGFVSLDNFRTVRLLLLIASSL